MEKKKQQQQTCSFSALQRLIPLWTQDKAGKSWLSSEESQPCWHAKSDHDLLSDATPAWEVQYVTNGLRGGGQCNHPERLMCFYGRARFGADKRHEACKNTMTHLSRRFCSRYCHPRLQQRGGSCWRIHAWQILPWSGPRFHVALTSTTTQSQHAKAAPMKLINPKYHCSITAP